MELIQTKELHVAVQGKNILTDINLTLEPGKITSIIGPNGSGKTTLLRTLCRNLKPVKGDILLEGRNIFSLGTKAFARKVAFLTQQHDSPGDLKVKELVEYGRYAHKAWWRGGSEKDTALVQWALGRTGMTELAQRRLGTLSGGERQRAWIAMALAQKPELLMLDEPTTYLDICHQLEVLELLKQLNQEEGLAIIMVLHDINQAARFSQHMIVLKEGRIFASGSPSEVVTVNNLREAFRVETEIRYDDGADSPVFYPKRVAL